MTGIRTRTLIDHNLSPEVLLKIRYVNGHSFIKLLNSKRIFVLNLAEKHVWAKVHLIIDGGF